MKPAPCTRPLAEQAEDRSGARRRGDHALQRLDLLSDAELDRFRERFGSDALDASDVLAEGLDLQSAKTEQLALEALENRIEARPILAVVVCASCGVFEVARALRPWPVDRAMRRSGLPERDVRAIRALLLEAEGDADLDRLTEPMLRELHALVSHDVDLESVRRRYG